MNQPSPEELAIASAERRDPGNPWVKTLSEFYQKHGTLSEKQMISLANVRPSKVIPHVSPHSEVMLGWLDKTSGYQALRNPRESLGIILGIANGSIQPTLLEMVDAEDRAAAEHEDVRERTLLDPGYDYGDYDYPWDMSDFH